MFRKSSRSAGNGCCVEVDANWRKSTNCSNCNCIEVNANWHKSSCSVRSGCVEVGTNCGDVHVRDSKNPDGGILDFSDKSWNDFLHWIKNDM